MSSLPGGAVVVCGTPKEIAIPGAEEEFGLPLHSTEGEKLLIVVIVDVLGDFEPKITDQEGLDAQWVPVGEVARRRLHPDFATAWPQLLETINQQPSEQYNQNYTSHMGHPDDWVPRDESELPAPTGQCRDYWNDDYQVLKDESMARNLPMFAMWNGDGRLCTDADYVVYLAMYDLGVPRPFYNEISAFMGDLDAVRMDGRQMTRWARQTLGLKLNPNATKERILEDTIVDIQGDLQSHNSLLPY